MSTRILVSSAKQVVGYTTLNVRQEVAAYAIPPTTVDAKDSQLALRARSTKPATQASGVTTTSACFSTRKGNLVPRTTNVRTRTHVRMGSAQTTGVWRSAKIARWMSSALAITAMT